MENIIKKFQDKKLLQSTLKNPLRLAGAIACALAVLLTLIPGFYTVTILVLGFSDNINMFGGKLGGLWGTLTILGALVGVAGYLIDHKIISMAGAGVAFLATIISIISTMSGSYGLVGLGFCGVLMIIVLLAGAGIAVYGQFFAKKDAKKAVKESK